MTAAWWLGSITSSLMMRTAAPASIACVAAGSAVRPASTALLISASTCCGISQIDGLDVGEFQAGLLERLVHRRVRARAGRGQRNLHALEIGKRLVAAAIDQVLAHEQDIVAVAGRRRAGVGDDRRCGCRARPRCRGLPRPSPSRHRARPCRAAPPSWRAESNGMVGGVEPFVAEIAFLLGDEDADVAAGVGDADLDRDSVRPPRPRAPQARERRRPAPSSPIAHRLRHAILPRSHASRPRSR